jgi:membrane-bound lytic murein transglycosylase D
MNFTSVLFSFLLITSTANAIAKKWVSTLPDSTLFEASEAMSERVEFWTKIYSYYTIQQGVFHLVDDPSFILGEIDLTPISSSSVLNSNGKRIQLEKAIKDRRQELMSKWKIADAKKIRLQMGLKDRMQKAFFLSGQYLPMMEAIFKKNGLPVELTRIVFVESSFNVYAQSKVGASGLWQIMPSVARPHGYIQTNFDKRNHPYHATELAAKILKANYKSLKSWPLAITAYNHGLTGVRRMVEKNRSGQIEDLIESDNVTSSWGFASKNFYSCFLAVLDVEKNAVNLFGNNLVKAKIHPIKEFKLARSLTKARALRWYNGSLSRFKQLNPHLNWARIMRTKIIPAGIPLIVPLENYHLVGQFKS